MKIDEALLAKYFKGTCNEAEQAVVEAYIASGDTPELDALMRNVWEEKAVPVKRMHRTWYAAAAAVLAFGIVCGWAWQRNSHRKQMAVLQSVKDTLYNASPNVKRVTLPDGSRILLGAYTQVVYHPEAVREVWLQGEAFFDVRADEQHPFYVHTDSLTTTVLGTTFNISTRNRANGSIEVSLFTGRIAIKVKEGNIAFAQTLRPGEMVSYRKGTMPLAPGKFKANEVLDWRTGKLIFENTTLEDAFARLQSRFGCHIQVEDEQLMKKKVSAEFTPGTSVESILQSLSYVHQFSYTQTSHQTFIVGK
ncbi:DUF4974 domain-containing protein [Chitinophaga horti]|uniref:DUF4974 domain-containing protein n=1 Tax=Chitinophaga horti TaxID=2920382 RepID=A0ABY6J295_9BACT|nr:FecR domain-containing protein [Chitinophaga horti]UYQ93771.1 DUF4974 domain-containing protein [Chitinophaga horti]